MKLLNADTPNPIQPQKHLAKKRIRLEHAFLASLALLYWRPLPWIMCNKTPAAGDWFWVAGECVALLLGLDQVAGLEIIMTECRPRNLRGTIRRVLGCRTGWAGDRVGGEWRVTSLRIESLEAKVERRGESVPRHVQGKAHVEAFDASEVLIDVGGGQKAGLRDECPPSDVGRVPSSPTPSAPR